MGEMGRAGRSQGPTFLFRELAQHGRNGEGRAQPRPDLPLPRAGAAWEKWGGPGAAKARPSSSASWRSMGEMGRAVRSQGPTFLFRELAQHGRNGEGRAQPRPDLPLPRAGAAWEKWGGPGAAKARPSSSASWRSMGEMGRAGRSQGPTFLFCELAQHGRNGEGRAQPRPDLPLPRAGAAWEKWGGPCAAKARPSSSASWRSMGEMGRAVRSQGPTFLFCELAQHGRNGEGRAQPRPDLPLPRAGAAWEKWGGPCAAKARPSSSASWRSMGEMGRAGRSQGPTFLFRELAQHGRNGEGRAQPRPDLPLLRAGAAWEKWGGPCAAKARPSSSASWRSMGEMGRAVRSQGPTFLFRELAQHGRNGEGRAQPRPDLPFLRAGAAWEKWGGRAQQRACFLSFVTKLLREKDQVCAKWEFLEVPFIQKSVSICVHLWFLSHHKLRTSTMPACLRIWQPFSTATPHTRGVQEFFCDMLGAPLVSGSFPKLIQRVSKSLGLGMKRHCRL